MGDEKTAVIIFGSLTAYFKDLDLKLRNKSLVG